MFCYQEINHVINVRTASEAMEVFTDYNPIIVTHSTGFNNPNEQEMPEETRKHLGGYKS